jgi:hypothetical protein
MDAVVFFVLNQFSFCDLCTLKECETASPPLLFSCPLPRGHQLWLPTSPAHRNFAKETKRNKKKQDDILLKDTDQPVRHGAENCKPGWR